MHMLAILVLGLKLVGNRQYKVFLKTEISLCFIKEQEFFSITLANTL